MHPLSKKYFGANYGSLAVEFHNGTAVVSGYVVKQIGTVRFIVSDGTTNMICELAQTDDEATTLTEGLMTIKTAGGKFIKKLLSFQALTTDGEIINWTKEEADQIVTFEAPETVTPVEKINEVLEEQFQNNGKLYLGSGNAVDNLVTNSNGEIYLAGAARRYKKGATIPASEGDVYEFAVDDTQDWTYVYAVGLNSPIPGAAITDLYNISLDVTTNGRTLTFSLSRDAGGNYHFTNAAYNLDITDDAQALGGAVYQGIQRVRFYEVAFGEGLEKNAFGSIIGETDFVLTATAKRDGVDPVVVDWKAVITRA